MTFAPLARLWRRHPLVPVALALLAADVAYVRMSAAPRRATELADFAHEAQTDGIVHVSGTVGDVGSPVAATRGEIKYHFRLVDPVFRDYDFTARPGESLPVVWYSPRPGNYGFPPEKGARFEMDGRIYPRRRLRETSPEKLGDLVFVSRSRDTFVTDAGGPGEAGPVERLRHSAAARISLGLDRLPRERTLMLAMTLGFRSDIPRRQTTIFRRAGTIHIFAISGLHVMLIAKALVGLFAWCGISRRRVILPLAPMIILYVYMTGMQPSAMRAAIMSLAYYAAPFFGRRPDPLGAIAFAAIALIVANPFGITDIGFILSFAMVTGLAVLMPPVKAASDRLFRTGEAERTLALLAAAGAPRPVLSWRCLRHVSRQVLLWLRLKLAENSAMAVAASLVSFPLTSYFFGICSPYAVLANIIVVPLAGLVMRVAGAGLIVSCLLAHFAVPFNLVAAALTWLMETASALTLELPGAMQGVRFSLWQVVLWYGGVIAAVTVSTRLLALSKGKV